MILDIFSELQRPDGMPEHQLLDEAIEQAKLADEMGFGCWWTVEHHGTGEFSYCSAPDMILAVLAQHTERIHLGHSGVLAPFGIHHPMQIAERAAWLDIVSGGRLEFGLARSLPREWETFGVDPDETREQMDAVIQMIPQMWKQGPFSYQGKGLSMPEREVVPKPLALPGRPHPPLWATSSSPEGFERVGRNGMGVLATLSLSPLEHLTLLFEHYQQGIDQCQPVGDFITDKRAVFTFVHCAETQQQAIESGALEATLWFMNMQHEVYSVPRKEWLQSIREKTVIWANVDAIQESAMGAKRKPGELPVEDQEALDFDDPVPVISLMNRQRAGHVLDPFEIYEALDPFDAVIIGDVDTCRRKFEKYAAIGVDNLMCLMQMAPIPHEMVMRSIRTTGQYLLPELAKIERPRSDLAAG